MTLECGHEPLHGIVTSDLLAVANATTAALLLSDAEAGSAQDNVEVHTVNADRGIVLEAQIDVLVNAEAEVAGGGEVAGLELELLHGQTLLQDLGSLFAADGHVASDLLVTTDAEGAHGKAGLAEDGLLVRQLSQHLRWQNQMRYVFGDLRPKPSNHMFHMLQLMFVLWKDSIGCGCCSRE